jgi:predicted small secreted protein
MHFLILTGLLFLGACGNMVQGVGMDIKAVGQNVQDWGKPSVTKVDTDEK